MREIYINKEEKKRIIKQSGRRTAGFAGPAGRSGAVGAQAAPAPPHRTAAHRRDGPGRAGRTARPRGFQLRELRDKRCGSPRGARALSAGLLLPRVAAFF